jgi:hypothetical protein
VAAVVAVQVRMAQINLEPAVAMVVMELRLQLLAPQSPVLAVVGLD